MSEKITISSHSFKNTEYATEHRAEKEFLEERGIKPTFVYKDKETGIRVYKYKKTTELFLTLAQWFLSREQCEYKNTVTVSTGGEENAEK